jgi:PAS domain S-box-containing protein
MSPKEHWIARHPFGLGAADALHGGGYVMTPSPSVVPHPARTESPNGTYEDLLNSLDAVVWEADPGTFACTFVSRQIERMLGYSVEEWQQQGFWHDCIPPEDRERVLQEAVLGTQSLKSFRLEHRLLAKNGSCIWVRDDVAVEVQDGRPTILRGMTTDITDRKRFEERYSHAQQIAHVGDWEWEVGTDNVAWSDEACRLLGCDPREDKPSFERFLAAVHPDDRQSIRTYIQTTLETGQASTLEFRVVHPGGEIRTLNEHIVVLRDAFGKPVRFVGAMIDVTEQKRTYEALRQSEERFRMLGTYAPVGIFSNDARGQCNYINNCGAKLSGTTPEAVMGLEWSKIIHPEDRDRVVSTWIAAVQAGKEFVGQYRFKTPEGATPWVSTVAVPLRNGDGTIRGYVGTLIDISEHKRLDQIKNEFISTVSHELRTPITAIRGSLKLIGSGIMGELPPKARKLIDVANSSCERLVHLVNDILDVERIETGRMILDIKPIELAPLVATAIEANRPYAQNFGVHVELDNSFRGAWVQVDPDRLLQVLTNLLSNAVKFSPKGAAVTLSVAEHQGKVRLAVIDHGSGIPPEFGNRIFNKFAQADSTDSRAKLGSGLGLNIAKSIVDKLGGEIGFESSVGVGTTFHVHLPLCHGPSPKRPIPKAGRPTVLSLEDDPQFGPVLLGILDTAGFNADLATTALEARELLARNQYAAMTLDLHLPDQDGLSFLRDLRSRPEGRSLPVVVVSAFLNEANRVAHGDAIGVVDWLGKPLDEERLKLALRRAIVSEGVRTRILHVEDDPCERDLVHRCLEGKAEVFSAGTLAEATRRLGSEAFDLMILDAELPDGSGADLLPLCHSATGRRLPIILYSSQNVTPRISEEVATVLRKSATSASALVDAIQSILSQEAFGSCAPHGGRP